MKKSKKLTILFSIVTISVLVAIGCSNDNSSDEPEPTPAAAATEDTQTPAATTDTTTTTTTTDTSSSGSEEGNEQPACDDTTYGGEGSCHYCGDGVVQSDRGEECDGGANCTNDCRLVRRAANGETCSCNDDCHSGYCDDDSHQCADSSGCDGSSIDHCSSVSGDNCDVCEACEAGYFLENGRCIEIPIYACIDYESGECTRCEAGYYLDNNGRCKVIPIEGCIDYESGECRSCRSGYNLNSHGECERDID